jgi:hypothetical protein
VRNHHSLNEKYLTGVTDGPDYLIEAFKQMKFHGDHPSSRRECSMTQEPIDHEKRTGRAYSPNPPSVELRQKLSETMKEFNRKTGKATMTANRLIARRRKAKP